MRKNSWFKHFIFILLGVVSFACAGCFSASNELTIDESGEVHSKITMVGIEFMRGELEKQKQEILKDHPNAVVTPVQEGNMSGFSIRQDYKDMDSFAADGLKAYVTRPNICKGIQKKSRWFYDAYAFDLYFEGDESTPIRDRDAEAMAQAMFSQIRLDFVINLPYEATSNNADSVSNGNKSLSWNLVPTLIHGGGKKITAAFKLWQPMHIGITAALAILLLAVMIIFALKAMTAEEGDEKKTQALIASGAGALLLALALGSAYLLLAPVTFTDSDIISRIEQTQGNNAASQNSTQANTAAATPSQPRTNAQTNKPAEKPQSQGRQNTASPGASAGYMPKPATNRQMAIDTLQSFHNFITQKEYRKAYNCLSPDYQSQVTYDGWASGFKNTVSSTPSDIKVKSSLSDQVILTYILTAVDNPGGTQKFNGTATVIQTNDGWRIDEIENKVR